MIFPFFLKSQQEKLNKRLHVVSEKHKQTNYKHVEGANAQIGSAILASDLHNIQVKTTKGYIRSFIPLTKEFKTRIICAKRIAETRKLADEIEIAISKGRPKNQSRQLKKSYSDSEAVLQRKQYHRMFLPIRIINEAEDAQPKIEAVAQINPREHNLRRAEDILTRMEWFHNPRLG